MLDHYRGDGLGKTRLCRAHDFQREIAGKFEQRLTTHAGARITLALNS